MSHDTHTKSPVNQDLERYCRADWLQMSAAWKDPFMKPVVEKHQGRWVVREDLLGHKEFGFGIGGKARAASYLFQSLSSLDEKLPNGKNVPLVYVAPRYGLAALTLAALGQHYRRKIVLFMPACQEISDHQAHCIKLGAEARFVKIAAMPVLNKYAQEFAKKIGGYFVPLGLRHELVTAALVRTAVNLGQMPREVWCAMSTGVLSRSLQIAWPKAHHYGVAVARNIKDGERGSATILSHHRAFSQDAEIDDEPFPSARNYDLKAYEYMLRYNPVTRGTLFWNVGANPPPVDLAFKKKVNSQRAWGDLEDLK